MVEISKPTKTRLRTCPKCKKEFETENLILFGAEVFRDTKVLCNAAPFPWMPSRHRSKPGPSKPHFSGNGTICPARFRHRPG